MLDDLVSVIETLQRRIRTHGAMLRANEIRTRVALIDPLLVALGWDVSDPALVTPEYDVGEGRADYALDGSESIPAAIVEAKRLGHALKDDERMQMLNYANARGVRYAAVTDGDVWELYEVFKQAPLEDRRLLSLRISGTSSHELALKLLLLWRPNLATGQPVPANEPALSREPIPQPATPMPGPPESPAIVTVPEPNRIETPTISSGWVSLAEFNPPNGSKPPPAIRFPDGRVQELRRWNDMLVEVATWLNTSGKLTAANVPVPSSSKIYIVHSQPTHPTGNPFNQYRTISNGSMVVHTHASAVQIRQHTRKLLQHCGVDPDDVRVRVD